MPAIKVTVTVEVDGVVQLGFPLVRRVVVDQVGAAQFTEAGPDAVPATALPVPVLALAQMLVVAPASQPVQVRLNGQTDSFVGVNAGGFLVLVDGDAGTSAQLLVGNPSATSTNIFGMAGGSV